MTPLALLTRLRQSAPPSRADVDAMLARVDRHARMERIARACHHRYTQACLGGLSAERRIARLNRWMRVDEASTRAFHAVRGELEDALHALVEAGS